MYTFALSWLYFSSLIYPGGLLVQHYDLYATATVNISKHFDLHVPSSFMDRDFNPDIDTVYPLHPRRRFQYISISYMLSSSAARHLVSLVEAHGIVSAPDFMLMKLLDLVSGCYTLNPLLIAYPVPENSLQPHSDDTDIQTVNEQVTGAPAPYTKTPWIFRMWF